MSIRNPFKAGTHQACARQTDTTESEKRPNVGIKSDGKGSSPTPSINKAFNANINHHIAEIVAETSNAGALSITTPFVVVRKTRDAKGMDNNGSTCPTGA